MNKCYDTDCKNVAFNGFKWCIDHQVCSIYSCNKIKSTNANYCSDHACKCLKCQNKRGENIEYCDRCYSNRPESCLVLGCPKPHEPDSQYCKKGKHARIDYPEVILDGAKICCIDNHLRNATMQEVMDDWDDWDNLDASAHVY